MEAKVSDFGLVKLGPTGDDTHVSSLVKGTEGYLDPEYCFSAHLTTFSDVFSFGVILLQLVTARPALDANKCHISTWARPSIEKGKVEEILDSNILRQPCNMEMMLRMAQLALRCVDKSPKSRPTMAEVVQQLHEVLLATSAKAGNDEKQQASSTSTDKNNHYHHSFDDVEKAMSSRSFSVDGIVLHGFIMNDDTDGHASNPSHVANAATAAGEEARDEHIEHFSR